MTAITRREVVVAGAAAALVACLPDISASPPGAAPPVEPVPPEARRRKFFFDEDGHLRLTAYGIEALPPDRRRPFILRLEQAALVDGDAPGLCLGLGEHPIETSPTVRWVKYRDDCARLAQAQPDNPRWPFRVSQCDAVLAWRAALPVEDRFWKPDPPGFA